MLTVSESATPVPGVAMRSPLATPPVRLTVMSYNIHGRAAVRSASYVDRLAAVIREHRPDVVALQEVHQETWRARFRDQAADLAERTGLVPLFGASMELSRGRYGNAVLTRGAVLHTVTHALPGRGEPRSMLEALLEIDGGVVTVFVTHLAAGGRFGAGSRLRQTARVARIVRRSRLPFILAGDFNSEPTSRELELFQRSDLVVSCFASRSATHRVTRRCLDYIFVDRRWRVADAKVIAEGPSDHWPLMADLRWEARGEEGAGCADG